MASYSESILDNDEHIVYSGKKSWVIFIPSFLASFIGIGIPWLIAEIIKYKTNEYTITNKRVIWKEGIIKRDVNEMPLKKIEYINIKQSLFGRLFNYGDIELVGSGGTPLVFTKLSSPIEFKKNIVTIHSRCAVRENQAKIVAWLSPDRAFRMAV